MTKALAHSEDELIDMIDGVEDLSDEGVLDRLRAVERVIWTAEKLDAIQIRRLHHYLHALRDEALKRMRKS
jgi:hypothetical protein